MLWNIIRDFIVQYITGGNSSAGLVYQPVSAGRVDVFLNGELDDTIELGTSTIFSLGTDSTGFSYYISLSDWLATTLTIICMCLIVAFAIWLIRWVFKAVSSAFLLK